MCLTLRAAAEEKTHPPTEIMGFQIKSSNFKLHFVTITNTKIVIERFAVITYHRPRSSY